MSTRLDLDALGRRFQSAFGGPATGVALAPGRVNLIGEHTDYNDGFVLPMAIDRYTAIAFRERDDRVLHAAAAAFPEQRKVPLDGLEPGIEGWTGYVAGVAWALERAGHPVKGLDLLVDGDVPMGAGLSSSAALELATARALAAASGIEWDPVAMAKLGQKAENEFVGMNCGLMDQLASAACQEGCALLLDCRSLESEPVELPDDVRVVVMDTGARRELVGSAYNARRASCETAVGVLRRHRAEVRALRDVTEGQLEAVREELDDESYRRARHVVVENLRPVAFAAALRGGDLSGAGRLMNDSHASLRDLYEVSSPELDRMTELARGHSACHGARLTGAGFGGCAIALVDAAGAEAFSAEVHAAYRSEIDLPSAFFVCRPSAGAHLA
jgi:galactokinase